MKKFIILLIFALANWSSSFGQESDDNVKVTKTFEAPRLINLLTVEPMTKKTMHFALMHTFGTLDGGIENLFGLDNGANIFFSFEFGLSDKFSLGASRTSRDKVYNLYGRYHLLQQTEGDRMPISVSLAGGAGVISPSYDYLPENERPNFGDRLTYFGQIMLARKFSDRISAQVSPMMSYFSNPMEIYQIEGDQNFYLAMGFSGKWRATKNSSLTLQWIPNLNSDLRNNLGIGWDIKSGEHVFQMYFVTSSGLNEQYMLAGGNGVPGEEFRIGFNVNRRFFLGNDW